MIAVPVLVAGDPWHQAAIAYPGPVLPRTDEVVTADALPTVQVNGVVWSQVIVGTSVIAGGQFTQARPAGSAPGTNQTPKANILSYSIENGNLNTGFTASTNGTVQVVATSPDGSRVYLGGDFTTVNGQTRQRIAAVNPTTGALISSFAANVGGRVSAIAATDDALYIGGNFTTISGNQRNRIAALNPTTGAVLGWNPDADANVLAMVAAPDRSRVIVGGRFQNIGGGAAYGLAAIDSSSGNLLAWQANTVVQNAGANAAILNLTTDGEYVYGNGYVFGSGGNFEGVFKAAANSGQIQWMEDCHGDTYANWVVKEVVYTVSHAHYCGNIGGFGESLPRGTYMRHALAFTRAATGTIQPDPNGYPSWAGRPSPSLIGWYPDMTNGSFTGQNQAAWTITGNDRYIVIGGEFPTVNGTAQQGLVRFGVPSVAPEIRGPVVTGGRFVPSLTGLAPGAVRVAFPANWDQDDRTLTYQVIRDGDTANPIRTFTADSAYWDQPNIAFTDTYPSDQWGTTHRYRLRVTDSTGNQVLGDTVQIVVPSSGSPLSPYAIRVGDTLGASLYWRLGESSGTTAVDWAGTQTGIVGSGVSRGTAGGLVNDPNAASTFNGTSNGRVSSPTAMLAPETFTVSAWFRTATSSGGKIVGFGDSQTGTSSKPDRHIYMDNSGRLVFGVAPRGMVTIVSPGTYRNNQWNQVVASLGPDGMRMYVNGVQVASRSDTTSAEDIFGYWRAGGDAIPSGWSNQPSSGYFNGAIDEVAVFPRVLTAAEVADLWAVGRGATGNAPPVASFTSSAQGLTASFNSSGSSDSDGTIQAWSWDFGDGSTSSIANPSRTYANAGTYTVRLTVTDNGGASASTTRTVQVTAPVNSPPTASFTNTVDGLSITVDGGGSSDPEGPIVGYDWDFGDGGAATGATASHDFATAGTYSVKLTVTDNAGATGSVTRNIVVSQPGTPTVVASDQFGRTVASGWGSADQGGSWSGTGASFSVNGSSGQARMANAGAGPVQELRTVSAAELEGTVDVALDKVTTGSGVHASVMLRKVGSSEYRIKVRLLPTTTSIQVTRVVSGSETTLATGTVPGTYQVGDTFRIAFQISGTNPTTISGKAWKVGSAVPANWQVSQTDSQASLQSPGGLGLQAYLSSNATNAPVVASFDNLDVATISGP